MGGSPAVADHIRDSLRRLADGAAGSELAEMARDVLGGRTDLSTVARTSAYADAMSDAITRFQRWREALTPEEHDQLIEETRAHLRSQEDATGT